MANKGMKGLLVWCKKHTAGYKDVNVTNMSSSWKDGLAFCALLHRFRPDLIDFDSLSKENVFYNNQLAFQIAEKELGIAALLDAEDMANMKVPDKLSVMTYLSQYYSCFRNCNPEENQPQNATVVNPESPVKVGARRRMTDESICCICGKRVHLVQRYFEEGKLYHRTCHRTNSLEKIRGKNYFIQHKDKKDHTEETDARQSSPASTFRQKGGDSIPTAEDDPNSEKGHEKKSDEPQRPELNLPNLVESLDSSKINRVNISGSSLSPVTGAEKFPSASPPSLVSELPKNKETDKAPVKSARLVAPKPRTRTMRSSTDSDGRASPAPVAQPRSKASQASSEPEKVSRKETDYDESLNPFGSDSGSDSDTTLSSTTSEDEDANPFENVAKKSDKASIVPKVTVVEPVNAHTSVGVNEGNPFEMETEEEPAEADKMSDEEYGNPFGEYEDNKEETVQQAKSEPSDRFNPFSPNHKKTVDAEKKKKRRAPIPPKGPASTVVSHAPAAGPSQKKPHAPPPPPSWKQSASLKMQEMNKANESDPRFASQSPKASRPSAPPQSPINRVIYASKKARKPAHTKTRSAPGYGYPLVKRKVEIKMSEEEIATELKLLDVKLTDYEAKGVKLEEMLRFAMDNDSEWTSEEDELLQEWFELVKQKNILLREESDLVFQMQQQKLEQEHADIEFQMRKLLNKPESVKTDQDKIEEEELLRRLVEVVERRNVIVNSIEEERQKEVEEDKAYEDLKKLQHNPSKKKKKNKVKKMFSKKDKAKKEEKSPAKEQQS